jgi:hypothetical protein
MNTHNLRLALLAQIILAAVTSCAHAQLSLSWYSVDAGGGRATGGIFSLEATIGQSDTGFASGSPNALALGYLPAFVNQPPACRADVGQQGGIPGSDGQLNNNDFVAFITLFFANDPLADVGQQGGLVGSDGVLNNNDFQVFVTLFFQGCP